MGLRADNRKDHKIKHQEKGTTLAWKIKVKGESRSIWKNYKLYIQLEGRTEHSQEKKTTGKGDYAPTARGAGKGKQRLKEGEDWFYQNLRKFQ